MVYKDLKTVIYIKECLEIAKEMGWVFTIIDKENKRLLEIGIRVRLRMETLIGLKMEAKQNSFKNLGPI